MANTYEPKLAKTLAGERMNIMVWIKENCRRPKENWGTDHASWSEKTRYFVVNLIGI